MKSRGRKNHAAFTAMLDDPRSALSSPALQTPGILRRWLAHVDDLCHQDASAARAAALLGVRLAQRIHARQKRRNLRNRCFEAMAWAVLGTTHRWAGNCARARECLERASALARTCHDADVLADVSIRWAILELFACTDEENRANPEGLAEALRRADSAVALAKSPTMRARSRNARAAVLCKAERFQDMANDARESLEILRGLGESPDFNVALSCHAVAAWRLGGATAQALADLDRILDALPETAPEMRARIFWCQAIILACSRRTQARAARLLDRARARFLRLGLQPEATAVSVELVRLRPEGAVPELMSELLRILDPGPVRDLVDGLRRARMVERIDLAESLRAMISGPSVLPMATLPA